jgi:putative CRISPR-associated protein (TIGR02619 family)
VRKHVIITVGISIFGGEEKIIKSDGLIYLSGENDLQTVNEEIEDNNYYQKDIDELIEGLKREWDDKKVKRLPAELASLLRLMDGRMKLEKEDKITLLYSETVKGYLASHLLEEFLNKNDNIVAAVEAKVVEGLTDEKDKEEEFRQKGLSNLINMIAERCLESEDVYIIATGGYKPESIYATLTGMLRKKPVYYLHEKFGKIIELPVLPVNLDFDLWRENYVRIELVIGYSKGQAESAYNSLSDPIKNLIELDSNNKYTWKPAGEMLYKAYTETSRWSPLQARGKSLLRYLKDNDLKKYEAYLRHLGNIVWTGDMVPEMVDHASKHHHNLFEIAEAFLTPILSKNENFMTNQEIYVLLCVILLHDCGHSLSSFPSSPEHNLLPSQIREWHNILGYERLNPCYEHLPQQDNPSDQDVPLLNQLTSLWKNQDSPATQCDMEAFWKQELEVIATIGLYHRKKMPLLCGEHPEDLPSGTKNFGPLKCLDLKFRCQPFTDNAVKIAALFRIIDNCDTQVSRAGESSERKLRYESAASDIRAEEKREKDSRDILSGILSLAGVSADNIKKNLSCEIAKQRDFHFKDEHGMLSEEEKKKMRCEIKKLKKSIRDQIEALSCDKRDLVIKTVNLVREVCSRRDFKEDQRSHFEKHAKVKKVIITPDFTCDKFNFVVRICGSECHKSDLEKIKEGMEKEYKAAEKALRINDIEIKYDVVPEEVR